MTRETFVQEMQRLQDEILVMGSMVERSIIDSVVVLKKRDADGARQLIAGDRRINEKRFEIEQGTLTLVATQQPIAGDLRVVASILEITGELERIGDYAKGIAKISLLIGEEPLIKPLVDIPRMADKACDMMHRALQAFAEEDVEAAKAIPGEDDIVDDLYNQVYRELMALMLSNPQCIGQVNYLLWVAHNLERTADRVINICERVIFTATGEMMDYGSAGGGYQLGAEGS